jgi:hypothetical protein
MCPYESDEARLYWGKACNFHRGTDPSHECGNPARCEQRFRQALNAEAQWIEFVRRWA